MKIYKEMIRKLDNHFDILEIEVNDILVKSVKGVQLTKKALLQMRSLVVENGLGLPTRK